MSHTPSGSVQASASPTAADSQQRPTTPESPRGGFTQDSAWYRCVCGYFFESAVSSSVSCPHCGGEQAW